MFNQLCFFAYQPLSHLFFSSFTIILKQNFVILTFIIFVFYPLYFEIQ